MKKLQSAIRRWLGVMSRVEVEEADVAAYGDHREEILRALSEMYARESRLKATEDRIARRFKELEHAEDEMKQIAAQTTLAVSDLVVAIEAIRQEERNDNDE